MLRVSTKKHSRGIQCVSASTSAAGRATPAAAVQWILRGVPQARWPHAGAASDQTHHDFHRAAAPGAAVEWHCTPASHARAHCDLTQCPGRLLQFRYRCEECWLNESAVDKVNRRLHGARGMKGSQGRYCRPGHARCIAGSAEYPPLTPAGPAQACLAAPQQPARARCAAPAGAGAGGIPAPGERELAGGLISGIAAQEGLADGIRARGVGQRLHCSCIEGAEGGQL
jgi:hypothetical protein